MSDLRNVSMVAFDALLSTLTEHLDGNPDEFADVSKAIHGQMDGRHIRDGASDLRVAVFTNALLAVLRGSGE